MRVQLETHTSTPCDMASVAQVLAPFPAGEVRLDRVFLRGQHAHVAVSAQHQWADIAGLHAVHANQFENRIHQLAGAERQFHPIDLGRIDETADMFADAEYGGSGGGRVAANAFEYRTAVAGHVRENVDFRIVPGMNLPLCQIFGVGLIITEL